MITTDSERAVIGGSRPEPLLRAEAAGIDPRGVAGYYKAGLLEKRPDGTPWIVPGVRERLERLTSVRHVHLLPNDK